MAFVAYHFNWSRAEVLEMPHWERQRWCEEISTINERINESSGAGGRDGARGQAGRQSLRQEVNSRRGGDGGGGPQSLLPDDASLPPDEG